MCSNREQLRTEIIVYITVHEPVGQIKTTEAPKKYFHDKVKFNYPTLVLNLSDKENPPFCVLSIYRCIHIFMHVVCLCRLSEVYRQEINTAQFMAQWRVMQIKIKYQDRYFPKHCHVFSPPNMFHGLCFCCHLELGC